MIESKILENIRGQLVLEIAYLQGSETAGRTAVRTQDESGGPQDAIDRQTAEQDGPAAHSLPEGESQQIREIRETILRIDQGLFGICSRCGNAIDTKLLLRTPVNRLCAVCRVRVELRRGHRGRCVPGRKIPDDLRF